MINWLRRLAVIRMAGCLQVSPSATHLSLVKYTVYVYELYLKGLGDFHGD